MLYYPCAVKIAIIIITIIIIIIIIIITIIIFVLFQTNTPITEEILTKAIQYNPPCITIHNTAFTLLTVQRFYYKFKNSNTVMTVILLRQQILFRGTN